MGTARRVAIVGAGLGGLAAAIALRQQGFEVRIYEQAPELAEFGAGINISPNSVKFFQAVGLAGKLHAISSEPAGLTWRDWHSGEIHNCLPFGDFERRYGAKYYVVHRSDLHRMLSEAVPREVIELGKRCMRVESRNGSVGLIFADGSTAERMPSQPTATSASALVPSANVRPTAPFRDSTWVHRLPRWMPACGSASESMRCRSLRCTT